MYKTRQRKIMEILETLALNKEVTQYSLHKILGCSYRTILRQLKTLQQMEFIRLKRTEPSLKGGKEKNVWEITFKGLLAVLGTRPNIWKNIDRIAEAHRDSFLLFKKWHLFEPIKKDIIKSMQHGLKTILTIGTLWRVMTRRGLPIYADEEELKKSFARDVLGVQIMGYEKEKWNSKLKINYEAIWKICKKDEELSKFIEESHNAWEETIRYEFARVRKAKEVWKSLS